MYQSSLPQYVDPETDYSKAAEPYGKDTKHGKKDKSSKVPVYIAAQPIQPDMGPPPKGYMVETYLYPHNPQTQANSDCKVTTLNLQKRCNGKTKPIWFNCPSCNKRCLTKTKCEISQKQK